MGRPPGTRNGAGNQAKSNSKSTTGGKCVGKSSNSSLVTTTIGGKGGSRPCNSTLGSAMSGGNVEKGTQDRSQLNFPYDIRLNGYSSLHNAVAKGTPRIKRILTEECDYIMECRVCKNLFRSVPNFITHKLNYCKKAFDSTWCIGLSNLIPTGDSTCVSSFNVEYEVDPELVLVNTSSNLSTTTESRNLCAESNASTSKTRSIADFYTELAEKTKAEQAKSQTQLSTTSVSPKSDSSNNNSIEKSSVVRLKLKPLVIPRADGVGSDYCSAMSGGGIKSVVVQQQIVANDPSNCDTTCTNRTEIVRKDTAILGPDGKVLCTVPGKGIEQVVSRLTAQLKALEEKKAQKMEAEASKCSIICDVCKTVFDSEKALRQHKRESLDCGKVWGFKSPNREKTTPFKISTCSDLIQNKRAKLSTKDEDIKILTKNSSENSRNMERTMSTSAVKATKTETLQSIRMPRFASPPKTRRSSYRHPASSGLTSKVRRNIPLPLSPVKRIKMKYKLESSLSKSREFDSRRQQENSYSCNRCSSSFTTKGEGATHLALCTGVINFANLKESEPPLEKIRISMRNDFPKVPSSPTPTLQQSPTFTSIISESHHLPVAVRQRHASSTSSSRGATPTAEVNNNKQYKNRCSQSGLPLSGASSSEEEYTLTVIPAPELEILPTRVIEEERDSDITSHDSGVSSGSSTEKKITLASSGVVKKVKSMKTLASSKKGSQKNVKPASSCSKAKKKSNGGKLSGKPEGKKAVKKAAVAVITKVVQQREKSTVVNLRKTITSRIRKSRRIFNPQQ